MISRAVITAVIGALGGLNQVLVRPLLGYSSLSHRGWLVPLSIVEVKVFLLYFMVYTALLVGLLSLNRGIITLDVGGRIRLYFLSLGGLPPLLGRFRKMAATLCLCGFSIILLVVLILSSVVSLCYYV